MAGIISKVSQSHVLQRECELMRLEQRIEQLEEDLGSQVEPQLCIAATDCLGSPTAATGCGSQRGR